MAFNEEENRFHLIDPVLRRKGYDDPQRIRLETPAPDIDEQRRVVQCLKSHLAEADALRAALVAQRDDIECLPQRMLAQAFN